MLYEFLQNNKNAILAMTETQTLALAGTRPSSTQLKQGLSIFFDQLLVVLRKIQLSGTTTKLSDEGMKNASLENNEPAMSQAAGRPEEAAIALESGRHGKELLRLGYTLSHVVHAYGSMCQSITELASRKNIPISAQEFHDLNHCLDVAIAGAVVEFQAQKTTHQVDQHVEHLGSLAHEMRNALASAMISLQMIERGKVGFGGSTGKVLKNSLTRIGELIDRSLTEVRLKMDPKINIEQVNVLQLVENISLTAEIEAHSKQQSLTFQIDPTCIIEADQQLLYSSVSNLIQNAIKYTRIGGHIQIRSRWEGENLAIEVEDECGGLLIKNGDDLFKPFVQKHDNREGLGLGLTIALRSITLNHGTIEARNITGKGCIFKITLPRKAYT